ncbi:MAG: hypothetical protein ABSG95_09655 [Solirubrobacteraceae bacterium]|jgi:hypothetical protein
MFLTSLARNTDFAERPFELVALPREQWATGDYVAAELTETSELTETFTIETVDGRSVEVIAGDLIVGALGRRAATLELVGDWKSVGEDLRMHTLTESGLLGRITSAATPPPHSTTVIYRGHVWRDGKLGMGDFEPCVPRAALDAPVVLIIGTSMECGKTVAAKAVVRRLKAHGLRVAAAKLTGVGHYRDILAMRDAGADAIFDFIDAGLPSTVVAAATYEAALLRLLSQLGGAHPDVVVAEAGASPLEPYNGDVAVRLLGDRVRCTVLCASDPYAVVGVISAFQYQPDLVSGRATSTDAAIALVDRLCGVPAVNLLNHHHDSALDELLERCLRLDPLPSTRAAPSP